MAVFILPFMVAIVVIWIIIKYNQFIGAKTRVSESWTPVRLHLMERYHLVCNLEDIVKKYASDTTEVHDTIVEAQRSISNLLAGNVQHIAQANRLLNIATKKLFAIAENYPELKAGKDFMESKNTLQNKENDCADAATHYNNLARDYNAAMLQFPRPIFASFSGSKMLELYDQAD